VNLDLKNIEERFLKDGYVIFPFENAQIFQQIRSEVHGICEGILKQKLDLNFFDTIHKIVPVEKLNAFRVAVIGALAAQGTYPKYLYSVAEQHLHAIVGNELASQRAPNLSIQYPQDSSSLLPLHSDVWDGNSPYEVVFWVPLVNCFDTKSMYVLPRYKSLEVFRDFKEYSLLNAEDLFKKVEPDLIYLTVPQGHGVIFSHTILHGNRINVTNETRWTFNFRFKSLMSPYFQKDIGESFIPFQVKPVTRIGLEYVRPEVYT
jgi:sporadic carbohydrate cluster 2OG-Fe(II) oxygenase